VLDTKGEPIPERYRESIACLATLHGTPVVRRIPVTIDHTHEVPDFDPTAMKIETRLLVDWYLPWAREGKDASARERDDYASIWHDLTMTLADAERHLLLRDFHSPNLIWRDHEVGLKRVGLIDFQDAMIGPTAYDVASLAMDARVTVPDALHDALLDYYIDLRRKQGPFDEEAFRLALAIMAAQRNCKLAGLWVRLLKRDGKPGYLKHMPRTLHYLDIALAHPALADLRQWCISAGIDFKQS
jgi:aminoglycoside/choline kinase family phosphotransferase